MTILHFIAPSRIDNHFLRKTLMQCQLSSRAARNVVCMLPQQAEKVSEECTTEIIILNSHTRPTSHNHLRNLWLKHLYDLMPDIVHLHGCWDYTMSLIYKWTHARGFHITLSPHNALHNYKKDAAYFRLRFFPTLLYQYNMTKHVDALIADTTTEEQTLSQMGWNKRVVRVENGPSLLSNSLTRTYQALIDTVTVRKIKHEELAALLLLLKKHYDGGEYQFDDGDIQLFQRITPVGWQRMQTFARHQHMEDIVLWISTTYIPQILQSKDINFDAIQTRIPPSNAIEGTPIADYIEKLSQDIAAHKATLPQIGQLYHMLHRLNDNEVRIIDEIKSRKLTAFVANIQTILHEMFALTEGFMLIPARNTRHTATLRRRIYQALFP